MKYTFGIITLCFVVGLSSCGDAIEVGENSNISENVDSLILQHPDSIELLLKRGNSAFESYNYTSAMSDAAKAYRLDSNNYAVRLLYADLLNNRLNRSVEDIMSAQRLYEGIIIKQPKNVRALVGLASTYLFQQDYDRTFQYANEALRINKKYRDAYVLKGTTYLILNNKELAKSSYETAIQQDPEFYEAYFFLGQIYESENDPLCIQYFTSAQKLQPNNLEFKYQVAYSRETFGEYEAAKEMYREMATDTVDIYVMRALFHQGKMQQLIENNLDSAMYFYKSALQTDPRFYEAWFNLAVCHEELGNKNQALAAYAKCLKYNPEFEPARARAHKLR